MMLRRARYRTSWIAVGVVISFVAIILIGAIGESTASVAGVVLDKAGEPVAGATVRIQATEISAMTSAEGTFTLIGLESGVEVTLTGWKEYYILC